MPARRNPTPSYLPHMQPGRARAVWTDAVGERHQKWLPGPYDSTESRSAFARLQLELAASPLGNTAADPDLARVVEAWRTLPDPIRRAVLALIGTAEPTPSIAGGR